MNRQKTTFSFLTQLSFTADDYKALVAKLNSGEIKVDNDTTKEFQGEKTKVDYQGQIKG